MLTVHEQRQPDRGGSTWLRFMLERSSEATRAYTVTQYVIGLVPFGAPFHQAGTTQHGQDSLQSMLCKASAALRCIWFALWL